MTIREQLLKLKRLADNMDRNCEDANAHSFVGSHRTLAVLIVEKVGLNTALEVMESINKMGGKTGLPGLSGVAGTGPERCYEERRKLDDGDNWDFPRPYKGLIFGKESAP